MQCKPIKKNGEVGVNLLAIISLAIVFCATVMFDNNIDNSINLYLEGTFLLSAFIIIDLCYISYAAFNAYLLKNIKFIWSMLAYSSTQDTDATMISPHMKLLWTRLIHHEQSYLLNTFTLNIFGVIPLNYQNLLRLNFWFGSIFMIYQIHLSGFLVKFSTIVH